MRSASITSPAYDTARHPADGSFILILNGGSSSIKFAAYTDNEALIPLAFGEVERIGTKNAALTAQRYGVRQTTRSAIRADSHHAAIRHLLAWIESSLAGHTLIATGHRVVLGGPRLIRHRKITAMVLKELKRHIPLDETHLPREIALIQTVAEHYPKVAQFACFDTAFHHAMPQSAKLMPIPWKYYKQGVQRLGFHGISFEYLIGALSRVAPAEVRGRVILAHLGSGASMAAVRDGRPMDTTMGYTPAGGLVMATRTGDVDPGLLLHLMRCEKLTPREMEKWITEKCGLLGITQCTGDMRDLLKQYSRDPRAAAAVDLFCHSARKWIGAMAASMGGLDTLIFSGGIGEHAWPIRRNICDGLAFLGIGLFPDANRANLPLISKSGAAVQVRVMATDEQIHMAHIVHRLLHG